MTVTEQDRLQAAAEVLDHCRGHGDGIARVWPAPDGNGLVALGSDNRILFRDVSHAVDYHARRIAERRLNRAAANNEPRC